MTHTLTQIEGCTFIDGIERNRENPKTFGIPTAQEISEVQPGWWIKVGLEKKAPAEWERGGERFWLKVTSVDKKSGLFVGQVDNDLTLFPDLTDAVLTVEGRHVIGIQEPPWSGS